MKKKTFIIIGCLLAYVGAGVLTFGMSNGYWRGKYPGLDSPLEMRQSCGYFAAMAIAAPAGLPVTFFWSGFAYYGLSFSCSPVRNY